MAEGEFKKHSQHPKVEVFASYVDRAVSAEPEIMYQAYKGADSRNFTKSPLKPGEQ